MAMIAADGWLGAWAGPNTLYFEGQALLSDGAAEVRAAGQGRFVTLAYTWAYEGAPQEGLIAFPAAGEGRARAAWYDTWHTGSTLMVMEMRARDDGVVAMSGSYAAPSGPDWGWRIELSQPQASALLMRHFNITPDGQEEIAVLAEYHPSRLDA